MLDGCRGCGCGCECGGGGGGPFAVVGRIASCGVEGSGNGFGGVVVAVFEREGVVAAAAAAMIASPSPNPFPPESKIGEPFLSEKLLLAESGVGGFDPCKDEISESLVVSMAAAAAAESLSLLIAVDVVFFCVGGFVVLREFADVVVGVVEPRRETGRRSGGSSESRLSFFFWLW